MTSSHLWHIKPRLQTMFGMMSIMLTTLDNLLQP